jgi:clan AA aspartic protease
MGLTYAEIDLVNPRLPDMGAVRTQALADTGAMMLCIPSGLASRLQLEVADHRPVTLADGRRVNVPYVGPVQVKFAGRACFVGALVMGDEVVLGAVPMEDMDLVVSPLTRTVTVNPASPDAPLHRA